MELWIRSQDKEKLEKVSNVQYYFKANSYGPGGEHYVGTFFDNLCILGKYSTKERALEVLDEIQRKIIASKRIECNRFYTEGSHRNHEAKIDIPYIEPIVYEMPLE